MESRGYLSYDPNHHTKCHRFQTPATGIWPGIWYVFLRMNSHPADNTPSRSHPKDPLHGVTLKQVLVVLERNLGWRRMADSVPIRCFQFNPTIKSSLTFLRQTPWARTRVEELFLSLPEKARQEIRNH